MRIRRTLLVSPSLFVLGGCGLIANLGQFDGATEVGSDAGGEAQVGLGDEEASSFDAAGADASGDAGGADSADGTDASPDPCAITSPNLLANPGFECGMSPWYPLAGNSPLEIVTAPVHSGASACLAKMRTQSYDGPAQNVAGGLTPGTLYKGSAWVRIGMTDGGVASATASMTATFACAETSDAGNMYLQIATGGASSSFWTQISGAMVVPSTCTPVNAGIYVEGPPPGVDMYVDDVYLSE
jgi:Carbohydrate binding domain